MRLEIFILALTCFFIYNTYTDGKYMKTLMSFKKYYKMLFYGLFGVGICIFLRNNPSKGKNILFYANNVIKYLPIDKSSIDMLSPIIDFTSTNQHGFMENFNGIDEDIYMQNQNEFNGININNMDGNIGGPNKKVKRVVSETKKKYVASSQHWKCGHCNKQLDHTFEIDHKLRLEYGGTNDTNNLVALCRNCHGLKTASENMN